MDQNTDVYFERLSAIKSYQYSLNIYEKCLKVNQNLKYFKTMQCFY